jgi:hypothetical protein
MFESLDTAEHGVRPDENLNKIQDRLPSATTGKNST